MENLRFVITNDSAAGGTALTPFWFGFHDNSFDLFNPGEARTDSGTRAGNSAGHC